MIWAAAFALLALLPLFGGDYLLQIGSFVAIQSIAVIGLGLLTGFAGRISLAQGALLGIGGDGAKGASAPRVGEHDMQQQH